MRKKILKSLVGFGIMGICIVIAVMIMDVLIVPEPETLLVTITHGNRGGGHNYIHRLYSNRVLTVHDQVRGSFFVTGLVNDEAVEVSRKRVNIIAFSKMKSLIEDAKNQAEIDMGRASDGGTFRMDIGDRTFFYARGVTPQIKKLHNAIYNAGGRNIFD